MGRARRTTRPLPLRSKPRLQGQKGHCLAVQARSGLCREGVHQSLRRLWQKRKRADIRYPRRGWCDGRPLCHLGAELRPTRRRQFLPIKRLPPRRLLADRATTRDLCDRFTQILPQWGPFLPFLHWFCFCDVYAHETAPGVERPLLHQQYGIRLDICPGGLFQHGWVRRIQTLFHRSRKPSPVQNA